MQQLDEAPPPVPTVPTGLECLDEMTGGGLARGRVWIITSRPTQGRTTLLTQMAGTASVEHSWATWLLCPLEASRMVAARLASCRSREVLWRLARGDATEPDARVRGTRRAALDIAPLRVAARSHHDPMTVVGGIEADPPAALFVDDAHRVSGAFPDRLKSLADTGMFVAVTLPRHLVVASDTEGPYLLHEWADIADVVLEIRQTTWPASSDGLRPGEADFSLLKNVTGPCAAFSVLSQPHYSRFEDTQTR